MGATAGPDGFEVEKISSPAGMRTPERLTPSWSLHRLQYPGSLSSSCRNYKNTVIELYIFGCSCDCPSVLGCYAVLTGK